MVSSTPTIPHKVNSGMQKEDEAASPQQQQQQPQPQDIQMPEPLVQPPQEEQMKAKQESGRHSPILLRKRLKTKVASPNRKGKVS